MEPLTTLIVVALMAVALNVLVTRFTYRGVPQTTLQRLRRLQQEIRELRRKYSETGDTKFLEKAKRKEKILIEFSLEVNRKLMLNMFITFGIGFAVFIAITSLFGVQPICQLPFPLPFIGSQLSPLWWFVIASMFFGAITSKLISPQRQR
ncbi:DUF106 domain-containing protein [archaeon]|nr:DUF106 domain-containing protein [archaeon]